MCCQRSCKTAIGQIKRSNFLFYFRRHANGGKKNQEKILHLFLLPRRDISSLMSSRPSDEGHALDNSQLPHLNDESDTLPYEPKTICEKGSVVRYWIVEDTKRCSQFCKDQLKVQPSAKYVTDSRGPVMVSCGPLKPKSLLMFGTSSSKQFIAKMALLMSCASIVTFRSIILIAMAIKALRR